jgi:hypothetical protein
MSGTVNYPKVIDQLTDVIKELNVPCGEAAPAAPSEETRRADAVGLLKALLSTLEQGPAGAAAAEHGASADKFSFYLQFADSKWWSEPKFAKGQTVKTTTDLGFITYLITGVSSDRGRHQYYLSPKNGLGKSIIAHEGEMYLL